MKDNLDAGLYDSDEEAENHNRFSWWMLFDGVMTEMDKLSWLISEHTIQIEKLKNLLYKDDTQVSILNVDIYKGWLKLFENCKF